MADLEEVTFQVRVNGKFSDQRFERWSIQSDFMTPADGWEFEVSNPEDPASLRREFQLWMPVELFVNGNLQLVGRIDKTSDSGASNLRVSGRDYIGDLIDPNVDPEVAIQKGDDLATALFRIFEPWGIDTITSNGNDALRNQQTGKTPKGGEAQRDLEQAEAKKKKLEPMRPEPGNGAYEFANKIISRHSLTIQPTNKRNALALCSPNYAQNALYTLKYGIGGNILERSADRDGQRVPSIVELLGRDKNQKGKKRATRGEVRLPAIGVNQSGEASPNQLQGSPEIERILAAVNLYSDKVKIGSGGIDPELNYYKPIFFEDQGAKNQEQLDAAARRMLSDRIVPMLTYRCSVRGFSDRDTGAVYAVDTIANVADDVSDVNEPMWIRSRTLRFDRGGPISDLELIRPYSYVL